MFWNKNKNKETVITTSIIKTSKQANYEKEVLNKVEMQISKCPECGANNRVPMFGIRDEYSGDSIKTNHCVKCGAEW